MTKSQKLSIRFLKVLFTVVCLVILFNITQPDTPVEKAMKEQKINEKGVRVACIVGIKKKLKHPGSMEIINRSVLNIGENKWIAEIGIRAKNNLGVMVSSNFICNICLEDGEYQLKMIRND